MIELMNLVIILSYIFVVLVIASVIAFILDKLLPKNFWTKLGFDDEIEKF